MKRALITGIAGQDGSYLAELLLAKGYEVFGVELPREAGAGIESLPNIAHLNDQIIVHFGTLEDAGWIAGVVAEIQPDECYHLAAASFVSFEFKAEAEILANNINGTHRLLSALKEHAPACRLLFAGTSEMFGQVTDSPQTETTVFNPRSIYGISKVAGHELINYYREQHGLWTATAFLYNHESPRRGKNFVTRKITFTVAAIKHGLAQELILGNLDALRDWGYAPDYVEAMWRMLQLDTPEDLVLASGNISTVRDFVEAAFTSVGLNSADYVGFDQRFFRPTEIIPLCGDASRARQVLHWIPTKTLAEMVAEMVAHDLHLAAQ